MKYEEFLRSKEISDVPTGFECEVSGLNSNTFEWQKPCIQWMLRRGRGALFQAPGLGKTIQQLVIAHEVRRKMSRAGIIFAPLAVAHQTIREAAKFGIEDIKFVRHQSEFEPMKIHIANYDMREHFNPQESVFVGADESSIFKSKEGAIKTHFCEEWTGIPYRFCFTATPSPNDYAELGNHAEFLGIMSRPEMEATFFYHDGGETSKWTLMPHAREAFWKWVASWALLMRTPSDIGFSDEGYILPKLHIREHILQSQGATEGFLIPMPATTLTEQRSVKRASIDDRCEACAVLVNASDDPWIVWCELNDEGDILEKMIPGSVQIAGKHSSEEKEKRILGFLTGEYTKLVTKCSIAGYGLNMQHAHHASRVNITHSAEDMYQEIRRQWRFGQKSECDYNLHLTESEMPILINVKRKQREADEMSEKVVKYMKETMVKNIGGQVRERDFFEPKEKMILPKWI